MTVRKISRRPSLSPRVWTDVRTDGRTFARSYADVITKFSRLDGLPIFLTHGASLARFARWGSATNYHCHIWCKEKNSNSVTLFVVRLITTNLVLSLYSVTLCRFQEIWTGALRVIIKLMVRKRRVELQNYSSVRGGSLLSLERIKQVEVRLNSLLPVGWRLKILFKSSST